MKSNRYVKTFPTTNRSTTARFARSRIATDAAVAAANRLSKLPSSRLLDVLKVMDQATPLGKNWLRGIAEDVADNGALPQDQLQAMVVDRSAPRDARYVGFLLLRDADAPTANQLLDDMLDDPSGHLRYEAVAKVLEDFPPGE